MTRSRIFLFSCLFFILGIFFGSYCSIPIWILFLSAGFFTSFVFLSGKNSSLLSPRRSLSAEDCDEKARNSLQSSAERLQRGDKVKTLFLLLVFLLLGFARIESVKLSESEILEIDAFGDAKITATGKISLMPEIKNGKQKITIADIKMKCRSPLLRDCGRAEGDNKINGKIIVYADRYPEYSLGDIIRVDGKVKIPEDFDGFEYKNYLLAKNIYYISYYPNITLEEENKSGFYARISKFRKQANDLIKKIFPQPQAGIISAMTLAIKSDLSEETLEAFNKTGTRHIIAISGMHMAIVALALMYFLLAVGLNRNHAFYFALLGIAFFVTLVGFPPSAVRAAIMAGLALFAIRIGRLKNAGERDCFSREF